MLSYFYGLRRKAGCMSLVMALAAMGLWIRSRAIDDKIIWTVDGWKYLIHSERGVIAWFAWKVPVVSAEDAEALGLPKNLSSSVSSEFPEWQSTPVSNPPQVIPRGKFEKIQVICGDPLRGFPANGFLTAEHFELEQLQYLTHTFSIWVLTLPLTLISAYLILWKSRKRRSRSSPVSAELV